MRMLRLCVLVTVALLYASLVGTSAADDRDFFKLKGKDKADPPAGKAEMLRHVPKKFATFQSADVGNHRVTLLLEGEKQPQTWRLNADAELKIYGWWGRLDQFHAGDRVWVWFQIDRDRQPRTILMLADEISEQDIHGTPAAVKKRNPDEGTVAVRLAKAGSRIFRLLCPPHPQIKEGDKFFLQTVGDSIRVVLDAKGLETFRAKQRAALRERWVKDGLPGTVVFLHPLSGEMEFMLDHEAMRWGRSLKLGDKVKLTEPPIRRTDVKAIEPIEALVKEVRPWRERTQLRLVVDGFAQTNMALGQRLSLHMTAPPTAVEESELPPDIDRSRTKPERIEWFLASTYCSCNIRGDVCTGMFYTLASCNVNACGMPNQIRQRVAALIDKGLTDRQIFEELRKTQGPLMLRPHLLP